MLKKALPKLVLPIVASIVYLILTFARRFPHALSYPWPITAENARRQYTLICQLLAMIKVIVLGALAYLTWGAIETALGDRSGLGGWFLPTALVLICAAIVQYWVRARPKTGRNF